MFKTEFSTDQPETRDATNDDALLFTRAALSGYLGGMEAMLKAGIRFSHVDWVDALEDAAHGSHRALVHYILRQLIAQNSDMVANNEWLARIKQVSPTMASDIEAGENFMRASRVREKLKLKGIYANEVERPDFIKDSEKTVIYEFSKDRESEIVGDHSGRRRHKMEHSADDQQTSREGASTWQAVGGDFAPIGSEAARAFG